MEVSGDSARYTSGAEGQQPHLLQVQPLFRVGDQLRMRVTPGGEVQRQFNTGTIVTIVGGSTEFTRTIWWPVRDENGMVGWVAQGNSQASYLALAR